MNILFVGGGTLGSLNPLLAVARTIHSVNPKLHIVFWTSRQTLEQRIVSEAGFNPRTIFSGKVRRYFSLRTVLDVGVIPLAFFVALVRLVTQRPQIVVSAGSYVAVPVHLAAWLLRIPTVTYQQDMQLGLANRIMAKLATECTASTIARAKLFQRETQVVGFALRSEITQGKAEVARQDYGLRPDWKTLLIIGGSSGAAHLNELVQEGVKDFPSTLNIVHIVGEGKTFDLQRPGYVQIPFTNTALPDLYAVADVVLCRAGSNVLAEMIALEKPLIIVPLPGTHQEANAKELHEAGAVVLPEAALTGKVLAREVQEMFAEGKDFSSYRMRMKGLWETQGATRLADIILRYV